MLKVLGRVKYGVAALILVVSSVATAVSFGPQASAYAGGDGTEGNPWQISNCTQLLQMGYESSDGDADDAYVLANDINCTGVAFQAIKFGVGGAAFNGIFNGAGHTISNVTINQGADTFIGLFGVLDYATVENLTLTNINVTGSYRVGTLAGRSSESTIENVHVTSGAVTANGVEEVGAGGLTGISDWSVYNQVSANVSVTGASMWSVGGLIGNSFIDDISKAAALGEVTGYTDVGGFIGYRDCSLNDSNEITESFAHGDVTGNATVGGFIGNVAPNECPGVKIIDSYARGDVTGNSDVGGFVGSHTGAAITHSYSTGFIDSAAVSAGGFVGTFGEWSDESIDSFWDTQTSGRSASADGVGRTTAQMKTQSTFPWDFEGIWGIQAEYNDGYPCLLWSAYSCGSQTDEEGEPGDTDLPNNGDGNNDGIIDEEQANVVTLISPVSNKYVTIATDDSCTLSDVSIANASSHTSQDTTFSYQSGFVNFTASGCDGDVANVQLYYHGVAPGSLIARKYNPNTNKYFTISSASITAAPSPLSGTVVSYAIIDNGELDIDATDGVIVDPVGLASSTAALPGAPNTGFARHDGATLWLIGLSLVLGSIAFAFGFRRYIRGK